MTWQHYPQFVGFAPDMPNTTPGVLTQTLYTMPTDRGLGPVPTFNEQGASALNTQSLGGFIGTKTDGTQRVFAGTATKLYETTNPPNVLTDRSGGSMLATTADTWSFCQFGDVTLAVNKNDFLQYSSSGNFAAVGSGPVPKASVICTCGPVSAPVVMAFDYNDSTNNYRDGWFASGLGDAVTTTGWTTGTNSCANGRLLDDIPGPVVAAIGFRDDVVAFKRTGMYQGTFTGDAADPWSWRRISSDIGCIGKNALTRANDILYWADEAGIWQFDGSYPRLVSGGVHNYWAANCVAGKLSTVANRNFFRAVWDKQKHWLHVFSGLASGPSIEAGMTWNSVSGLWTQHGGTALGGNPFINAGLTTYAVELIAPRLYVTNNKKIGAYTIPVDGTNPPQAIIDGWLVTDHVQRWILKGLRPHWKIYSTTTVGYGGAGFVDANATPPTGNFRSFISDRYFTEIENVAIPGGSVVLTDAGYGVMQGQLAAAFMSWRIAPPAGIDWEIVGVSLDMDIRGHT